MFVIGKGKGAFDGVNVKEVSALCSVHLFFSWALLVGSSVPRVLWVGS